MASSPKSASLHVLFVHVKETVWYMNRFGNTTVNQPKAFYTDHNFCAPSKVAYLLANWACHVRLVFGISCVALNKERLVHTIHCTPHSWEECQIASSNGKVVIMPFLENKLYCRSRPLFIVIVLIQYHHHFSVINIILAVYLFMCCFLSLNTVFMPCHAL